MKKTVFILFILVCTFSVSSFGLKELLDLTEDVNPDLKVEESALENSLISRKTGLNRLIPDLDLSYSFAKEKNSGATSLENSLYSVEISRMFGGLFMQDRLNVNIENLRYQMSELDFSAKRNQIRYAAYQYYFQIVRKVNELEVHRINLKLIEELLNVAKINMEAGTGLKSDVLRVEAQKLNIAINKKSAENALMNILIALNAFLDNKYEDMYKAAELFIEKGGSLKSIGVNTDYKFAPVSFEDDVVIRQAKESEPSLRILEKDVRMSRDLLEIAKTSLLPDVTVAASKTEVDKTDTPATVRDKDYSVSLMFSQKLFDSGTTHLEIASARNKLKQAKLKYEYNLDLVEASMREALSNYSEAVWRTQAAEKSAEYADENMRLIRERFEAGEAGIVELIDAQILMTDTKMSELKAYFDERAMLGRIYVNMDKTERLWELADEKR